MKSLVVYDSNKGNTEKIANSIGAALSGQARVMHVKKASAEDVNKVDRLIVGSPTLGGRATEAMTAFLGAIPESGLGTMKVAAFDTRLSMKFVKLFGYAADRILAELSRKGGTAIGAPAGFMVKGRNGPLQDKELERAADWAKSLG